MKKSKRAENKAENKAKIIEASRKLFSEKGLDKTSVSDIVKMANIGRGTFYNYFKTPTAVFTEIIDKNNKEINEVIVSSRKDAKSVYEFLYSSFKAFFDLETTKERALFQKNNQNHIRSVSYSSSSILSIVTKLQRDLEKENSLQLEEKEDYKLFSLVAVAAASELSIGQHQFDFKVSNEKMAHFLAKLFTEGLTQTN